MTKISVIGAGNLGSSIAYEIASRGLANEIILIDILKDLAEGQAIDIQQALPFRNRTKVYFGGYERITNSDIIIITAGKPRTTEMKDRLDLAAVNLKIMGSITTEIKHYSPKSIIITITNPMDIINHFIYQQGFPRNKVLGSGGQLDSARLRVRLGHPETEVEAFVLGEHGDNQVPIFSRVKMSGKIISFSESEKKEIKKKIKESSPNVIAKKGATIFAPASNTADMVEVILKNQQKTMICSVNLEGEYGLQGISLGVPVILGRAGIEKIEEWNLDHEELQELQEAGRKLKRFYSDIEF